MAILGLIKRKKVAPPTPPRPTRPTLTAAQRAAAIGKTTRTVITKGYPGLGPVTIRRGVGGVFISPKKIPQLGSKIEAFSRKPRVKREALALSKDAKDIISGKIFEGLPSVRDRNIFLSTEQEQAILKSPSSEVGRIIFEMPSVRRLTAAEQRAGLTVERAPSLFSQLKTSIKESTPSFQRMRDSNFKRGITTLIGLGLGTESFLREKAIGKVTNLKDMQGNLIFTPTQARNLVGLSVEVAESYLIGAGVGKVATLGRGGIVKLVPSALGKSKSFKKLVKVFDVTLLSGLTVVEANSLNRTLKRQGQKAAFLQLVGLASFGLGFSKTGLKPSAQAQREFSQFAKKLKKTVPKSKRGEFLRKKKKKKKKKALTIQEQITLEEFEEVKALQSSIERRLARAKTRNDQLRMLHEIAKHAKTAKQKEGFKDLLRELTRKEIIKPFKVRITPTGRVSVPRIKPRKVKIIIPKKVERGIRIIRKKTKRITKKQSQQQKQITKTKKQVQRLRQKLRQKVTPKQKRRLNQKLNQRQKLFQKQVIKQIQLQKQKMKLSQKQKQTQKQKQLQKLRLKTLQKTLQRTAQKEKLRLKARPRPRRRIKKVPKRFKRIPRIWLFPPRFKVKRRKKKKKKRMGYNVFARPLKRRGAKKRPKLIKINRVPLTKTQARKLGATLVDRTLSRTFSIRKTKGKPRRPKLRVKTFHKRKFRTYKKVKGRRVPLKNKFIEKRRHISDTRGEKRGLTLRRGLARLRKASIKTKPIRRQTKRTPSPLQLKNLARGRKIRMANLKKRK